MVRGLRSESVVILVIFVILPGIVTFGCFEENFSSHALLVSRARNIVFREMRGAW